MSQTTTNAGHVLAQEIAKRAFENHFALKHHCGAVTYCGPHDGSLVYFNNRPGAFRTSHLEEFRQRLADRGVDVLGEASWPVDGLKKGYSLAVVIDCGPELQEWVFSVWDEMETRDKAPSRPPRIRATRPLQKKVDDQFTAWLLSRRSEG